MSKNMRPSLQEIREKMNEITHRKPTPKQIDDLKNTLKEIEENTPSTEEKTTSAWSPRKRSQSIRSQTSRWPQIE